MLGFKPSVRFYGVKNEVTLAIMVCNDICKYHDTECQINSVNDGKHSRASLHYSGNAFDLDTHDGAPGERFCKFPISGSVLADQIRNALPPDFDVIFEDEPDNEHIHVEYQPKRENRL